MTAKANENNYLVNIENLTFCYEENKVIFENLNLQIDRGDIIGIKGDSGSGKTTLCHILCGIIPNNVAGIIEGGIYISQKNIKNMTVPQISVHVGIVFQDAKNQFFAPTLEENLAFAPENLKLDETEIEKRVIEALNSVGLEEYRFSSPFKLSGGQQHLAALASIITLDPDVIILDEIMASLDDNSINIVQDVVENFSLKGKALIIVEHEENRLKICDKILTLKNKKWEVYHVNNKQ